MKITVPLVYRGHNRKCVLDGHAITIPEISASEAPLAIEMPYEFITGDGSNRAMRLPFRSYQGRLWHQMRHLGVVGLEPDPVTRESLEALDLDQDIRACASRWDQVQAARIDKMKGHWHRYARSPLTPKAIAALKYGSVDNGIAPTQQVKSPDDAAHSIAAIEEIAARTILLEGEVWVQSAGPIILLYNERGSDRGTITLGHPDHIGHENGLIFRHDKMEFARDCATALYRDVHVSPLVEKRALNVIAPEASIPFDDLAYDTERYAWRMVYAIKDIPMARLSADSLRAIGNLRSTLQKRADAAGTTIRDWTVSPYEYGHYYFEPAPEIMPLLDKLSPVVKSSHPGLTMLINMLKIRTEQSLALEEHDVFEAFSA